jgi:hypothetical protein
MNDLATVKRGAILELESALRELPPVEIETYHHFSKGLYAREIRIPAEVLLTGKIHRLDHLCIVASGTCRIITEDADNIITGPCTFTAFAGVKKVIYAETNTVFMTVHSTDLTDISEIERTFVVDDYNELEKEA